MGDAGTGIDEEALEIIEVRLGIDVARLQIYLHAQLPTLGFGPARALQVKQFNKGQSNPTYLLRTRGGARGRRTQHWGPGSTSMAPHCHSAPGQWRS